MSLGSDGKAQSDVRCGEAPSVLPFAGIRRQLAIGYMALLHAEGIMSKTFSAVSCFQSLPTPEYAAMELNSVPSVTTTGRDGENAAQYAPTLI